MTTWVPVACPDCGKEDGADSDMLDRGYFLRCPSCDCRMVPLSELADSDTGES